MSALPNRSDLNDLMPSNGALRKRKIKKHSHQTTSNNCLEMWVKQVVQEMADPLSIIIVDLYLLKCSDDFEKQQLYLAHLEEAVSRVQAAIGKLATVNQDGFNAQNKEVSLDPSLHNQEK